MEQEILNNSDSESENELDNNGYIYVLYNEMFKIYGEHIKKIGKAKDINKRLKGYTTSYITPPIILYRSNICKNYSLAESCIFTKIKDKRIKPNREFFNIELNEVIEIIDKTIDDINDDFVKDNIKELQIIPTIEEINYLFNDFINDDNKLLIKYKLFNDKIKLLNIPYNNDILLKYQNILCSNYKFQNYLTSIAFLKNDDFINNKIKDDIKYNKIKLIRSLMNKYKIDYFNIKHVPNLQKIDFDDNEWNIYYKIFRLRKNKPTNYYELIVTIVSLIRSINSSDIIISSDIRIDKKNYKIYDYNFDHIKENIELNHFANPSKIDYHEYILKKFDLNDLQND